MHDWINSASSWAGEARRAASMAFLKQAGCRHPRSTKALIDGDATAPVLVSFLAGSFMDVVALFLRFIGCSHSTTAALPLPRGLSPVFVPND